MFSHAWRLLLSCVRTGVSAPRYAGLLVSGLVMATFALVPAGAFACEDTIHGADPRWEEGANWSAGRPPTSSEEVCVKAESQVKILSTATAATVHSEGAVEIEEGGKLEIAGSGRSTFVQLSLFPGSSLVNAGSLYVTREFLWNGPSKISGAGEIDSQENGSFNHGPGGTLTLEGSKFINEGTLTYYKEKLLMTKGAQLTNKGKLVVDAELGEAEAIEPGEGSATLFINLGKLERDGSREGKTIVGVPFENRGSILPTYGKFIFRDAKMEESSNQRGGGNESTSKGHHPPSGCGDPVSCATGNFTESQTDLSIGGRGVGLNLTRTYNSQAAAEASTPGTFGYGWTSSFSDHLVVEKASQKATVYQANGSTVPFTEKTGGTFAPPVWSQDTLSGSSESGYTLTLANQTKYKFNGTSGKLESVTDRNGNATTLVYNGTGRLETITDPAGRKITLTYNSEGLVESAKDPMGHVVKYTYESGNLASATEPGESTLRWQFKYDSSHEITTMTDGRGGKTINEYNSSHQVVSQTDPAERTLKFEYEPFHTTITNETTGRVTEESFTSAYEPGSITRGAGTENATTEEFIYNEGGQEIASIDGNGHKTTYEYDSEGDRTSLTDPNGNVTKWTYDSTHDTETTTTPKGETTTFKRNSDGDPEVIERPAPGGKKQKTTYKYDSHGDVTSETNPLEHTWTFEYDTAGDRTVEIDPEGNKRTFGYNEDSQETSMVSPRGNVKGAEASKYTTKIERDAQGRALTITNPLGHTTKYTYDGNGNVETMTDGNSHTTTNTYNGDNQRIKVKEPNGKVTETEYDGEGQMVSQTDGNKHTTKYERNSVGEVVEVSNPLGKITTEEYDHARNLRKVTDSEGRTTTYTYDPGNRLTEISYSSGTPHTVKYEYDKDGDRTKMIDGTGTTTYTFDELDRLTETENGHKEKVKYEYDLANDPIKITYPNSKAVTRAYNKDRRLESVTDWLSHTTKFSYDPDGDLAATTFPSETKDEDKYVYSEADQLSEIKMAKSTETLASLAYVRDNDGQVKKITSKGLPGTETIEYAYDENDRLTSAGTTAYEYDAANNPTKEGSSTNTYNEADELESGTSFKYAYDELGERTKAIPTSGPAITYGYNQAGNLITVTRPKEGETSAIEDSYAYDGNGLRASETISGKTSYLAWGAAENLPVILYDGTNSYIYGPSNTPIEQINSESKAFYLHHDQQGSTRLLTGSTGKNEATMTYDAYGNTTGTTGTVKTPLGYDGQYTSSDTGLIYLRARTYDPKTAQFLTVDPLETTTRAPYDYAADNPLNHSDPTGLCHESEERRHKEEKEAEEEVEREWRNCGTVEASFGGSGGGCTHVGEGEGPQSDEPPSLPGVPLPPPGGQPGVPGLKVPDAAVPRSAYGALAGAVEWALMRGRQSGDGQVVGEPAVPLRPSASWLRRARCRARAWVRYRFKGWGPLLGYVYLGLALACVIGESAVLGVVSVVMGVPVTWVCGLWVVPRSEDAYVLAVANVFKDWGTEVTGILGLHAAESREMIIAVLGSLPESFKPELRDRVNSALERKIEVAAPTREVVYAQIMSSYEVSLLLKLSAHPRRELRGWGHRGITIGRHYTHRRGASRTTWVFGCVGARADVPCKDPASNDVACLTRRLPSACWSVP